MENVFKVGAAITSLRARKQDRTVGSRVEHGKFQLIKITYDTKGKSQVIEISTWMPADEFIAFVDTQ